MGWSLESVPAPRKPGTSPPLSACANVRDPPGGTFVNTWLAAVMSTPPGVWKSMTITEGASPSFCAITLVFSALSGSSAGRTWGRGGAPPSGADGPPSATAAAPPVAASSRSASAASGTPGRKRMRDRGMGLPPEVSRAPRPRSMRAAPTPACSAAGRR